MEHEANSPLKDLSNTIDEPFNLSSLPRPEDRWGTVKTDLDPNAERGAKNITVNSRRPTTTERHIIAIAIDVPAHSTAS